MGPRVQKDTWHPIDFVWLSMSTLLRAVPERCSRLFPHAFFFKSMQLLPEEVAWLEGDVNPTKFLRWLSGSVNEHSMCLLPGK